MSETRETWFDEPLIFTIAERHVRGRFVRLGPVLNRIMAAHSYPPVMEKLLEEISYKAHEYSGKTVTIDAAFVEARLGDLIQDENLAQYIL